MGTMDPEYDKAKHGFLRELSQFHESRGSKFKGIPAVNGQEVDVYLLYQIVTSHGGWEKINVRNEWDDLLEHFNLPRSTNGGLILKNIYLKYLELYEKIHYLGEDVDGRHDDDDEFDDFRHRRRYNQYTTPNKPASQSTTTTPLHISTIPVTDSNRAQLGMSTRLLEGVDYDRLVMSLQSPLPNDQDMAISVCTLLSNETKHVLKFPKAPRILELLLGHAGVFNHCKLRELLENSYLESRQLCHNSFWMETIPEGHARHVLCECFVQKINQSVGAEVEYLDFIDTDVVFEPELTEEEKWILMNRKRISERDPEFSLSDCCGLCPCKGVKSQNPLDPFPALNQEPQPLYLLRKTAYSDDRIGQRITQIANILRNLSFEEDNALLMANNQTLLRFILLSSECCWGTIPQLALDLLGNIAQHLQLREPSIDPLSCRIMSLVVEGLFSPDRFRILRSLESLRELCKKDGNDEILNQYVKLNVYKRICELLTISDIMLLIYTLECLLSMTGLGEAVCNELSRVQGSVATLVSLVTVEAQSYGPKGCILMRVVETVTGNLQTPQQSGAVATPQTGGAVAQSATSVPLSNQVAPNNTPSGSPNTIVAPIATIPRSSHSPAPSFPSSSLPSIGNVNKSSITVPTSTAVVLNPVHSGPQNHPSALQVQLQQPPAVNISQNSNIGCNQPQHMRVPSPALSPSSSLSPAPSPGPPLGPMAHLVQSASSSQMHLSALQKPNINGASEIPNTGNLSTALNIKQMSPSTAFSNLNTARNTAAVVTFSSSSNYLSSVPISPVYSSAVVNSGSTSVLTNASLATCPTTNAATSNTLAQVSNQSINQQLIIPSISLPLVTPKGTLSEEGWALAWLKGAFEVFPGTSIEQGESYRMYCSARKNPQKVLSMDQFIQCVKCAYGAPVGPVIKQFGSSSLSFFEGIRPKIISKPTLSTTANSVTTSIANPVTPVCYPPAKTGPTSSVPVALTTSVSVSVRPSIPTSVAAPAPTQVNQLPVSVHIPSTENKTLSPILKATLSRPPKPKNPSGVAQRQQKKLQQESLPKKSKRGKGMEGKVNGVDGNSEMEESSASSSVNSNEEQEVNVHQLSAVTPPLTSFQGILRNGLSSEESSKDGDSVADDFMEGKNKLKGMLIDLLERKVNPMESPNGLGNREIRISDRGLELVDKLDENNSNSSIGSGPVVANMKSSSSSLSNALLDANDSQQSQMTFYSASEPQLGIKRPHCSTVSEESSSLTSAPEPPIKRSNIVVNGNGCAEGTVDEGNITKAAVVSVVSSAASVAQSVVVTASSMLQASLSSLSSASLVNPSPPTSAVNSHIVFSSSSSNNLSNPVKPLPSGSQGSPATVPATGSISNNINNNYNTSQNTSTNAPNQMMQLRLSVNPQNQLTFARQLVLPSGQQLILSTTKSQNPLQGQVIISKPHVSSNDQMAKAIIILQPSQQQSQQPSQIQQQLQQQPQIQQVSQQQQSQIQQMSQQQQPQMQQMQQQKSNSYDQPYLCEWSGCGQRFNKPGKVFLHVSKVHTPETLTEAVRCEWGPNGCDPLLRKRLSLMTHLQDRHCTKHALEMSLYRRRNKIEAPPPPQHPTHHHLGYAPNAAFHAIKRHAMQFMNPKELLDDNEGPVTKSIRLTAALILKNLVNYSSMGRRILRGYESQLATIAMSNVESSRTIAQLLYDMKEINS
ncbi:unnamed protein product [Allacma fusca]|uniref:AT-rich interactive domain-containing protein 2 n=1 Tax=Allacma fusca TaxID=39272 RepID=A0A8J2JHR1_9HEXA|nr:unnamed protein product [Allacma fusca]